MPSEAPAKIPTSRAGAPWLVRQETRAVLDALAKAGHEARIVGGTSQGAPASDVGILAGASEGMMPDQG